MKEDVHKLSSMADKDLYLFQLVSKTSFYSMAHICCLEACIPLASLISVAVSGQNLKESQTLLMALSLLIFGISIHSPIL